MINDIDEYVCLKRVINSGKWRELLCLFYDIYDTPELITKKYENNESSMIYS